VLVPVLSVLAAPARLLRGDLGHRPRPRGGLPADVLGGLGSLRGLGDSSVKASVLGLTGLSVAVAFSVGLFNIGSEGQLVVGAITAAYLGAALDPAPRGSTSRSRSAGPRSPARCGRWCPPGSRSAAASTR
jgi:ABC-type uncharacterized transport system permease subunit